LRLVDNNITTIPDEIAELKTLSKLYNIDFNCNPITEISPKITALNSLYELFIEENQLTELPPEIFDMTNLQRIHGQNSNLSAYFRFLVKDEKYGDWHQYPDGSAVQRQCRTQYRNFSSSDI